MKQVKIREAVGVFDDQKKLDKAISELESTSFPRHDISVLGTQKEIEEKFGTEDVSVEWLEDNPEAPRNISIRPEEKTIGAAALVGVPAYFGGCAGLLAANPAPNLELLAAVAAGSLAGALLGGVVLFFIRQRLHKRADKQIRKGGLLLWVRTPDSKREEKAKSILSKHGARHVHVHSTI